MAVLTTGTYFSGATCSFEVNAVVYNCGGWDASLDQRWIEITVGASNGADEFVPGSYKLTGNIEMPFNLVKMPLTGPRGFGAEPSLLTLIPYTGGLPISCYAWFKARLRTKVDQAYMWTLEFTSTGPIAGL